MRVMVSGANGFVGRELVTHLLKLGEIRGRKIEALLLLDQHLDDLPADSRLRRHSGSITDPALLRRVLADGIDVVFHLVSIPGGAAEMNYELGYQVNLQASLELLHQLRNHDCPPCWSMQAVLPYTEVNSLREWMKRRLRTLSFPTQHTSA